MALKKCKECGKEVSTQAQFCPGCGAPVKKGSKQIGTGTGCLIIIGFIVLLIVFSAIFGSKTPSGGQISQGNEQARKQPKANIVYKEKESVHVGYTSYAVWRSWWSDQLSRNEFLNQRPNAMFLFVELSVRNDDKKARMIPPFKLIDETGAEYEPSQSGWALEGSIGVLDSLNPAVTKQGFVVFDVPKDHNYRLKLSGGYWSKEDAYIQLTPQ